MWVRVRWIIETPKQPSIFRTVEVGHNTEEGQEEEQEEDI